MVGFITNVCSIDPGREEGRKEGGREGGTLLTCIAKSRVGPPILSISLPSG